MNLMSPLYSGLGLLRRVCAPSAGPVAPPPLTCKRGADGASSLMGDLLRSGRPVMVGRFGSTEMACLHHYLGVRQPGRHLWLYLSGKREAWWWPAGIVRQISEWSGFFPAEPEYLARFGELMLQDLCELDLLGSWLPHEWDVLHLIPDVPRVRLLDLEPYWAEKPWSAALRDRKVLVVHPFADTIKRQYAERRASLFVNPEVLPAFELETLQAVQSLGGGDGRFADWFEALQWMKDEIDRRDYDVCLIGCGAYGLHLAAHVKRAGRQAVHLGGALQLLFGIRGRRWEDPAYGADPGFPKYDYLQLFNDAWVRPGSSETTTHAGRIEGGCYW